MCAKFKSSDLSALPWLVPSTALQPVYTRIMTTIVKFIYTLSAFTSLRYVTTEILGTMTTVPPLFLGFYTSAPINVDKIRSFFSEGI